MLRRFVPFGLLTPFLFSACMQVTDPAMLKLAREPITSEPWATGVEPWTFGKEEGRLIRTSHFQIYTTIDNPLFQHMLGRVLEGTYQRHQQLAPVPTASRLTLDCYVLASRGQWERYTRENAGDSAPVYLQIASGGYSQKGVFAGYDIGFEQTLSVVAHEAWHQYSWFVFKDRLPSWLEEGMATQNESVAFENAEPVFMPEDNHRRKVSLRNALRGKTMWKLQDLVSTHAGRVIGMDSPKVDAYYAQLWSLTLFLQQSPVYGPRLKSLFADAEAGKLTQALRGTSVTQQQIANYTEHWNEVAGPVYLQKYINPSLGGLEEEYLEWAQKFID